MAQKTEIKKIVTPEFTVAFPSVFEPEERDDGSKSAQITAIFTPDAIAPLLEECKRVAKEKFGDKLPKGCNPFRKSDNPNDKGTVPATDWSFGEGTVYVSLSKTVLTRDGKAGVPPTVAVDRNGERKATDDPNEIYPGCKCRAVVSAFAYNNPQRSGVKLTLWNLLKTNEGERIGMADADPVNPFADIAVSANKSLPPVQEPEATKEEEDPFNEI